MLFTVRAGTVKPVAARPCYITTMIRDCEQADFDALFTIINDAAQAYKGVIPLDRWQEPYMSRRELRAEIESGVAFSGWEEGGELLAVMGIQPVRDVTLVRHAYTLTAHQGRGIGSQLLAFLSEGLSGSVLVGTWGAAAWAISFYEKHGFRLVSPEQKDYLLAAHWSIPQRQIATSVVLANHAWWDNVNHAAN